jgi:hypothetical protein
MSPDEVSQRLRRRPDDTPVKEKNSMNRPLLALVMTLAFAVPLTAHATTTVDHNNIVGDSAYASWDFVDGNIGTFVNVVVDSQVGTSPTKFVSLSIAQYQVDTGNVLISGVAYAENFTFTLDPQLGSATLHVANAVFQDDNSFTFFNVDMDLTWTATADAVTQRFHEHYRVPGMVFNSNFQGTFRDATASGSVLGKSVPNRGDVQFTPAPSTMGQLQHNQNGSVTVTVMP